MIELGNGVKKAIIDLEVEVFGAEAYSENQLLAFFACEMSRVFIRKSGALISGYILCKISFIDGFIEVFKVVISPESRRMGIAKSLFEELFDYAEEVKVSEVILEVRASNKGAISLYKNLGFDIMGERKNYYTNPQEKAIIFRKYIKIEG
ncbi:MAG: ribosomal protein S18-alanine N-acetyltransferase [Culicoidibacterales bacterium]